MSPDQMPELPEVEVVSRGLAPLMKHRIIKAVRFSRQKLRLPKPKKLCATLLIGPKIVSVTRRAKYIVIGFDNEAFLLIHLGMTGRLCLFPSQTPVVKHDHCFWLLDNNMEMRLNDTRRFGSIQVAQSGKELEQIFAGIGPDPFSRAFTPQYLHAKARRRNSAVKNFIMDNHTVPGIGNIYANETLYAAGVLPTRNVSSLTAGEWDMIVRHSKRILAEAIECGGTTISDFVNSSGEKGYFQVNLLVYGKNGKPCRQCGGTIKRSVLGGRASYFCPTCQK